METEKRVCAECGKEFQTAPGADGKKKCPQCESKKRGGLRLPGKNRETPKDASDPGKAAKASPAPAAPAPEPATPLKPLPSEKNELAPGTVVHGFEIIRKLGSGGMGIVYLATQRSMQRQIALKVLNPAVTKDAAAVEQFLTEVRNTGKLQHPNIVNAFDAGEENGIYFLAMQYIKGDTLDNILQKNGPQNEIKMLELAVQIANALDYVWKKYQMFHRDIKPGNFMLNEDGAAMLMDLGIAQKIGEQNGDEDSIEGSPYYMSPEQIQGNPLSWTTDLYSLGASLYQLIVGVPPYDDKSIDEILKLHCTADFPDPELRKPGCKISPETVRLIRKMMDKDPAKRFDSWESFIKVTREIVELLKEIEKNPAKRLEIDAAAAAEAARKAEARRRKITIITLSSIFAAVLIAVVAGYFLASSRNTASAEELYGKLDGEFRKFKADPSTYQSMRDLLTDANHAAAGIGVPAELLSKITEKTSKMEPVVRSDYHAYSRFETYYANWKAESARAREKIRTILNGSSVTLEQVNSAAGMADILSSNAKQQKPLTDIQKETFRKINSELADISDDVRKCKEKLANQERAQQQRELERQQQAAKEKMEEEERRIRDELAQKEREALRQAENQRQAEARRLAEAEAARQRELKRQQEAEKAGKKVSSENLVQLIKKERERVKSEFITAYGTMDMKEVLKVSISKDVLDLSLSTSEEKSAMENLKKEYDYYHDLAADALKGWEQLQDLNNLDAVRGISVRSTMINNGLKISTLHVDKIQDGQVYFQESKARPENFIQLRMQDKEKLAQNLVNRKKLYSIAKAFYFGAGLYRIAYTEFPASERSQMTEFAKEVVKQQYQTAKKKGDIRAQQRLRQDYSGSSAMADIFKQ